MTITLLDGGMGQELLARSQREITTMWSADIMLHEPELVRDLHLDFINAGAQVITLNTYTATPQRLAKNNALAHLVQLHQSAIDAAKAAIALSNKLDTQIAGCLPPLVASYHPSESPDFETSLATYRELVALQASGCDLFICETMSSIAEAKAACTAAAESGLPVWLAFSVCDDTPEKLRGGEPIVDALDALVPEFTNTVLLNCSRPESIAQALPSVLAKATQVGVYANGFTSVDSLYPGTTVKNLQARHDLSPENYAQHALYWAQQGVSIIGGCCEISPSHIQVLAQTLSSSQG